MEQPQLLAGNRFQLIDDPQIVWVVESGSVLIFAVPLTAGSPAGPRQFLFEAQAGDWLFGADYRAGQRSYGLMVMMADKAATLVPRSVTQLSEVVDPTPVNAWLDNLAPYIDPEPIETVRQHLPQTIASGVDESISDQNILAQCVDLTQQVLVSVQQQTQLQQAAAVSQLQQQEKLNRQALHQGLVELAGVLIPDYVPTARAEENELLQVMGSIGRHLDVAIVPPTRSDQADGSNTLEAIARNSGLQMRPIKLTPNWWQDDCGTLLGFRQEDAPVALLPTSTHRYTLYDPRQSQRLKVDAALAETLEPDAFLFYRPFPNRSLTGWAMLRFALRGRWRDMITILLISLAATLLNWLTPIITGQLINQVIPNAQKDYLMQLGLAMVGASIGAGIFQFSRGFVLLRLSMVTDVATQAAVWDRVLKLPVAFFRGFTSGDLLQRVDSVTQIQQMLSTTTLSNLLSGLFISLNLVLMVWYSPQLALVAIAISLVLVTGVIAAGLQDLRQNRMLLQLNRRLYSTVIQLINGIAKLRISGAESRAFAHWANQYQDFTRRNLIVKTIQDNLKVFSQALTAVAAVFIFWVVVSLMNPSSTAATLSLGHFIAFNAAFGSYLSGVNSFSNTLVQSLKVFNLWEQAQPILWAQPETSAAKAHPGILTGKVSVEQITFRYHPEQAPIINQVSLHAEPGEFIALVGPSGSGKSTLLRLLLGFETPESGVIYYDRHDLSQVNIQAVRRQFGVVLQTSQIMPGSIFDNIAGSSLITQDEAWEAAQLAGLKAAIAAMPMELQTVISEGGSNLSGGQRQQLLIARALAQNPKILLFDEATSALDNQSQAIVSASLANLNVTRIVIAHRLSTIKDADRIYVVEKGIVAQHGTFRALSQQPGLFAHLMARQMA
jgi:NHLM bacteriocin system ABC transporter ATP-binding protein